MELQLTLDLIAHLNAQLWHVDVLKQHFCLFIKICEYWRPGETQHAQNPKKPRPEASKSGLKGPPKGLDTSDQTPLTALNRKYTSGNIIIYIQDSLKCSSGKLRALPSSVEWYHPL